MDKVYLVCAVTETWDVRTCTIWGVFSDRRRAMDAVEQVKMRSLDVQTIEVPIDVFGRRGPYYCGDPGVTLHYSAPEMPRPAA